MRERKMICGRLLKLSGRWNPLILSKTNSAVNQEDSDSWRCLRGMKPRLQSTGLTARIWGGESLTSMRLAQELRTVVVVAAVAADEAGSGAAVVAAAVAAGVASDNWTETHQS
jgi:hypothetical protein